MRDKTKYNIIKKTQIYINYEEIDDGDEDDNRCLSTVKSKIEIG